MKIINAILIDVKKRRGFYPAPIRYADSLGRNRCAVVSGAVKGKGGRIEPITGFVSFDIPRFDKPINRARIGSFG